MTTTTAENGSPSEQAQTTPRKPRAPRSDKGTTRKRTQSPGTGTTSDDIRILAARALLDLASGQPVILESASPSDVNALALFGERLLSAAKDFRQKQLDLWSGK